MTTALYRISSNEVMKISITDHDFAGSLDAYRGVVSNATYPDGTETRDPSGNKRVLGYAKILNGTVVQNATQNEIDTFAVAEIDDYKQGQTAKSKAAFDSDPMLRRQLMALVRMIVSELNILRDLHSLPDRTAAQAKTKFKSMFNKDD
jgi:hypothetical protein